MKKLTTPQRSSLVYLVCLLFIASTTIQPSGIASSIATNDYDVVILAVVGERESPLFGGGDR